MQLFVMNLQDFLFKLLFDFVTGIYFILLIVIGSYFSVNICVAAISGVFLRVRHEHQVCLECTILRQC
jgi:hypothetical protein